MGLVSIRRAYVAGNRRMYPLPFYIWVTNFGLAAVQTIFGVSLTYISILAAENATVTLLGFLLGGGTFAAGLFKMLNDHRAIATMKRALEERAAKAEEAAERERALREQQAAEAAEAKIQAGILAAKVAALEAATMGIIVEETE